MKPETEQRLATFEVILEKPIRFRLPCHDSETLKPYIWDANKQGIFSPFSLIESEGWIQETDIEEAIKNWRWSEQTGLAAKGILECGEPFCIEDGEDEEEILLGEETKLARAEIYQNLLNFLLNNLNNSQAFTLSCNLDYSLSVIVGQISENKWIGICPTVPQETGSYVQNDIKCSLYKQENKKISSTKVFDIEIKIQKIIDRLESIKIYGWYDGGYNNVHDYKIILATGENKATALENALLKSGLLEIYLFEKFELKEQLHDSEPEEIQQVAEKFAHLNKFLTESFRELLLYRFCFWDYEHLYILGETGDRDRVGISLHSQFTYNP